MDSCASELGTVLCARVAQLQEGIASSGGTPKLASQIQKQIDDDMKEIMHAARAILYLRNTLSLISRLPPELLARIFSFLFTEFASGSSSSTSPGKSTIPVWLAATHVCGLWRQVALDNPSLWSHNIGAIRGWVPEQLSRSQQVPISITNNPNLRDIRTMEVALREIHRARRINLHFTTRGDRKVLQYMEQSAPLLEHLSISMAVPSSIPRNILQHDAPLLTCLELRNCAPPKVLTLYRNLVKLSIHEGYMAQDLLVSVLASIPRLQFLDITNADGKRFRSTARLVDPHAAFSPTLPSTLHTLILTDSPDNIRWLWDHVHLLSSPRTRVQCTKSILPLTAHTRRDTPWQVQKWLPSRTTEAKNPSSIRTLAINCLGMSWSMDGWTQIVTTSDKTTDAVSRVDTFLDSHCLFHFESAGPPISHNGAFAAKVHATSNSKAIIDALYVEGVAAVHLEEPNDQWLHVPKGGGNLF
ncbi:hypothetical protein OF83DRAFT_852943 [Amylostereum chailletii]|nr:hypothetical protein OF83DRAFT_852943 [Amylostereum chailletii]